MRVYFPLLAAVASLLCTSPLWSAPPTDDEIAKAAKDLGDRRFAVREKAAKLLWEAGKKAEPALQKALASDDAETVRRAKQILERFSWGIYPDTPKEIIDLVTQFRDGTEQARTDAIGKLIPLGRPGLQTLHRLVEHANGDLERKKFRLMLAANADRDVPPLMQSGDLALAEELLAMCIDEDAWMGATNFAAFHYLTGSLDKAISRWEKSVAAAPADVRAGIALAHLYRAKGDFDKAKAVARTLKNDRLLEALLWEESNWKELAQFDERASVMVSAGRAIGARAAYHRLAGDAAGFDKTLNELRKMSDTTDPYQFFGAFEALILNGKINDAIQLLVDRKIRLPVAFELLAAQLKFREAQALANEAKGLTPPEQFELDLARARKMHLLGEKEQALQLFTQLGGRFQQSAEMADAERLLKSMVRLKLNEPAQDIAARFLILCQKQQAESIGPVLTSLFDEQGDAAEVWWDFLRRKFPDEDAGKTMKNLVALIHGKPVAERDAWIKELTETTVPAGAAVRDASGRIILTKEKAHLAAAEVLQAAGNADAATAQFQFACQDAGGLTAHLRYAHFLSERKRWSEAAAAYQSAARKNPGDPLPYFLFGWALEQSGKTAEGRKIMDQAHMIPLGNEPVRMEFANQLAKRGFDEAARRECDLVGKVGWYRDWYVGNVLNRVARDAYKARDFATAAACFEKALIGYMRNELVSFIESSAFISVPQTVVHLRVRALLTAGKTDEGVKLLREALQAMPGDIEMIIQVLPDLEKAKIKDGDALYRSVYQQYEQLCADYPNSAFAHNSLAWLAANCRRNLNEAAQHAEQAVKLEPKNAGYIDTLAEAHFRRGEKDKAIELMKRCVALEPKRAYFRKQLERYTKGDINAPVPDAQEDE